MNMSLLTQFVDANKLGGWVRAGVASILAVVIGKNPTLAIYLDPTVQQALGVVAAGIVVGIWSQLTKTDAAKIAAVNALPKDQVIGVVVAKTATDGVLAAAKNPEMPNVVMTTPAITAAIAAVPVTPIVKVAP
jgi:hypothetical protein